jgi:molecular chaperone GrpE (heat shock protein)
MSDSRLLRWHETRDMLAGLLAWLDESYQQAEAAAPEGTWSDQQSGETLVAQPAASAETAPPDLFALHAAMTALRQEVKLQTRAARRDREQAEAMLAQLSQAVAQFDSSRQEADERHQAAVQEAGRAPVETLVEVHDALSRAAHQADRVVVSAVATLRGWLELRPAGHDGTAASGPQPRLSQGEQANVETPSGMWQRVRGWLGGAERRPGAEDEPVPASRREVPAGDSAEPPDLHRLRAEAGQLADRLAGLTSGYRLGVQRLERTLAAYGIEPIACLGHPVDAERMEVVQTVADPAQPSGVVVDEVRRGYLQHGRVYRFAQVVATRQATGAPPVVDADTGSEPEADR